MHRSKVVAAHGDGLLEKDCQENVEECGKAEVDQGQATAEKCDGTDTNEERVAECLELSVYISLSDCFDLSVWAAFHARLEQEVLYNALRFIRRTRCDLPFLPSIWTELLEPHKEMLPPCWQRNRPAICYGSCRPTACDHSKCPAAAPK